MRGLPGLAAALFAVGLVGAPAALAEGAGSAHSIEVVATTSLTLESRTAPARIAVHGRLVDNTARGLPFRDVEILVEGPEDARVSATVVTDRLGRFTFGDRWPAGPVRVVATFEGEPHVEEARFVLDETVPALAPAVVGGRDGSVRERPGIPPVEWVVTADGAPLRDHPVRVRSSCQPIALPERTDADGRVVLALDAPGRSAGSCEGWVDVAGDAYVVETTHGVVLPFAGTVELQAQTDGDAIVGQVLGQGGGSAVGLPGVRVLLQQELQGEWEAVDEAWTDTDGGVRFPRSPQAGDRMPLRVAVLQVNAAGAADWLHSEPFVPPAARPWRPVFAFTGLAALALAVVWGVLLLSDWRRARPDSRRPAPGQGPLRHGSASDGRRLPEVVQGVTWVVDADTGRPIGRFRVLAESSETAEPSFCWEGADGVLPHEAVAPAREGSLRIESSGYRTARVPSGPLPPRVTLISMHHDVLDSFVRAVEAASTLRRDAWWGRWTVSQARRTAVDAVALLRRSMPGDRPTVAGELLRNRIAEAETHEGRRGLTAAIEAHALLTDRILFSGEPVQEGDVALAHSLEQRIVALSEALHAEGAS